MGLSVERVAIEAIGWTGVPSASASSGFTVRGTNVLNQKPGILLHGLDGAAALLVVSAGAAERHGLRPMARIVASAVAGVDPDGTSALGSRIYGPDPETVSRVAASASRSSDSRPSATACSTASSAWSGSGEFSTRSLPASSDSTAPSPEP